MAQKGSFHQFNGHPEPVHLDALIIGAGFTGCYLLHKLRGLGFATKVVETGSDLGGVWYWNRYPGARVDSQYPVYSLSLPEVWKDWDWEEKYPSWEELQRYFAHVDKKLDLKKDVVFNSTVVAATFDESQDRWHVTCDNGQEFQAKFLISGTGFSARRYLPKWKGMATCKVKLCHSSFWSEDIDVKGKKIAIIGSGASGVQIAQEVASTAEEVTVFIRTPNLCIPMRQRQLTKEEQVKDKLGFPQVFKDRITTYGGYTYGPLNIPHTAHSAEEREALFEKLWAMGGFAFMSNSYNNIMTNKECNRLCYDFWRKKTLARISDPAKAEILAPAEPPHPYGAKRPSLEMDYYEKLSQPNVKVVSLKETPIEEFTETGVKTSDGMVYEADIIALATGFDAVTGGINSIAITGLDGKRLADKWELGTYTNLGISTSGYPNFFFTYGPQSPTAFSNGPSCIEAQCDWIAKVLTKMREDGSTRIDAQKDYEDAWRATVNGISEKTLVHGVDTWYMGTNIPGKPKEALNYGGGVPAYVKALGDSFDNGLEGFNVS